MDLELLATGTNSVQLDSVVKSVFFFQQLILPLSAPLNRVGKFREAIEKLVARPSQPPGGAGTANRLVVPPSGPGTAAPAVLGTPPANSQPGSSGSGSAVADPVAMSDSAAPVVASGASGYDYLYI